MQPGQIQVAHRTHAVRGAVDRAVVHADQVPVAGQADVALEGVGARLDGGLIGEFGVFGDAPGCAAVRSDKGPSGRDDVAWTRLRRRSGLTSNNRAASFRCSRTMSRSDDHAGRAPGPHDRPAGLDPGLHATGQVDRVVALTAEPGGDLSGSGADSAHDDDAAGSSRTPVSTRPAGSSLSATWIASAACPAAHSSSSRTSSSTVPGGWLSISATETVGTSNIIARPAVLSLEQLGQPSVGQLAAFRLAGRAVLERLVGEGHLRRCRHRPGRATRPGHEPSARCASRPSGLRRAVRRSDRLRRAAPCPSPCAGARCRRR